MKTAAVLVFYVMFGGSGEMQSIEAGEYASVYECVQRAPKAINLYHMQNHTLDAKVRSYRCSRLTRKDN